MVTIENERVGLNLEEYPLLPKSNERSMENLALSGERGRRSYEEFEFNENVLWEGVQVDEGEADSLKDEIQSRGQFNPITLRARFKEVKREDGQIERVLVFDVLDGFHRCKGFAARGVKKVWATVIYGMDQETYEEELIRMTRGKVVSFARTAAWETEAYQKTRWYSDFGRDGVPMSLGQALGVVAQNSSGRDFGLTPQDADEMKVWLKAKVKRWGKALNTVYQEIRNVEMSHRSVVDIVLVKAGGPHETRRLINPAQFKAIVEPLPHLVELQKQVVEVVINNRLDSNRAGEIARMTFLLKENPGLVEKVLVDYGKFVPLAEKFPPDFEWTELLFGAILMFDLSKEKAEILTRAVIDHRDDWVVVERLVNNPNVAMQMYLAEISAQSSTRAIPANVAEPVREIVNKEVIPLDDKGRVIVTPELGGNGHKIEDEAVLNPEPQNEDNSLVNNEPLGFGADQSSDVGDPVANLLQDLEADFKEEFGGVQVEDDLEVEIAQASDELSEDEQENEWVRGKLGMGVGKDSGSGYQKTYTAAQVAAENSALKEKIEQLIASKGDGGKYGARWWGSFDLSIEERAVMRAFFDRGYELGLGEVAVGFGFTEARVISLFNSAIRKYGQYLGEMDLNKDTRQIQEDFEQSGGDDEEFVD